MSRRDLPLLTKRGLTLAAAKKISAAAERYARRRGWNVVIAVVDEAGHLLHLVRMDGTQIGSIDVAQAKARTALAFRRPSKSWEEALAGGRRAVLGLPGVVPVEGGLPLLVDGEPVGAIGVSGVTSEQDGLIAAAGAALLR
jgi:uncharacterized protein GlcG (DUF336 family)